MNCFDITNVKVMLEYIEGHPQVTKLIIYVSGILIAWVSGFFKLIGRIVEKLDMRLRLEINPCTARYSFIHESPQEKKVRLIICLSVAVSNPSEKMNSISDFKLWYKIQRYSRSLYPSTFPSLPQIGLGKNVKLLPVFFSSFPMVDKFFGRDFCPDGKILPGDQQNGYLMFVDDISQDLLSTIKNNKITIQINCLDVRNKKYRTVGCAQYLAAEKLMEFIPGLESYKEGNQFLSP